MALSNENTPAGRPAPRIERTAVGADGVVRLEQSRDTLRSVEIADVDLVLSFADGTHIVLPNGAVDALSGKAPIVDFAGNPSASSDLLKAAGKTAIVTAGNVRLVTEELDTRATTSQGGEQQSSGDQGLSRSSAPDAPVFKSAANAVTAKSGGVEGGGSAAQEAPIQPLRVDIPTAYKQGIKVSGIDNLPITTPYVDASYFTSGEYKLGPSGTTTVPVGSKTSVSNALADQATRQLISGTSGADVIDHNSAFSPNTGVWTTTLHLDFPNFTDLTSVTLTIDSAANTVAGIDFAAAQATRTSLNTWTLVIDSNTITNGIDLVIRYNIAADGTSPNTLIGLDVEAIGKAGVFNFDLIKNLFFHYADATTAADFTQTTASGEPIYALPAFGVGYEIHAGGGNDTVNAGAGADLVFGEAGNDVLNGNAGNDTLDGGGGADTLDGGTGTNTAAYTDAGAGVVASLSAGSFNGVNFIASGGGILNQGNSSSAGDAGGDLLINIQNLTGSAFDDTLIGNAGANVLSGGAGNDTLEGMAGADTLDGGTGNNTASYAHSASGVVAALSAGSFGGVSFSNATAGGVVNGGTSTSAGDAGGDTLINIQNLTGSDYNDVLVGDGNANVLLGGAGDDVLQGMAGADIIDGGAGTNTVSYSAASNGVVASLAAGTYGTLTFTSTAAGVRNDAPVSIAGDAAGDTLNNIRNMIGSAFNDTLIGDANDNILDGGGGSDSLIGNGGNDTASYATAETGVVASLSVGSFSGATFLASGSGVLNTGSTTNAGYAAGDLLIGITNLQGSNYADTLVGDANSNMLSGGAGNDTLQGMAGADTLDGGSGSNTASYSAAGAGVVAALSSGNFGGVAFSASGGGILNGGNAAAAGDAAGDLLINMQNLTGSAYADVLVGSGGANLINGGGGDDVLQGLGGGDTLDGGTGSNSVSYDAATAGVVASLASGTYGGVNFVSSNGGVQNTGDASAAGNAAGETLINIQNLLGSAYNDTLVGDSNSNLLEGKAGADTLNGNGGADTASYASSGHAVIASLTAGAYGGISFVSSGGGITNQGASGTVGDAAGDTLIAIENLAGSAYDDLLVGDAGANVLSGGSGADTLVGLAGGDTLDGGSGTDTVSYADSSQSVTASLSAGTFNAVAFVASGGGILNGGNSSTAGDAGGDTLIAIENLVGSANADTLIGDSGTNVLSGGDGNDLLEGMAGADTLDGGNGTNTASYAHAAGGVIASLTAGTFNTVAFTSSGSGIINGGTSATAGDAGGDTLIAIQNLSGSAYADMLVGDSGANTLSGGDGNDTLQGMAGADTLDGGNGTDTASYANAASGVIASLSTGTFASVAFTASAGGILNGGGGSAGDAAGDTLISIENLSGSAYDDTLVGSSGANTLSGGDGNDLLEGMAGADTLDGGNGSNTASYAHAAGGVIASLSAGTFNTVTFTSSGSGVVNGGTSATAGDAGGDTLIAIQNLSGSAYADTLVGDSGANTLSGGDGNDTLQGLAGADVLDGGNGTDTASYANAASGVIASLSTGTFASVAFTASGGGVLNGGGGSAGDAAGDTLISIENLSGSAYADTLVGSSAANTLSGGDGNDLLEGLAGADVLDGGNGTDTASYANATAAVVASLTAGTYGGVSFTSNGSSIVNGGTSATAGDAGGDTLTSIENLSGSIYADLLVGDSGANTLSGGDGNDTLQGLAGADVLDGGNGTDTVSYINSAIPVVASLTAGSFGGVSFTASGGGVLNGGDTATAGDAAGDTLISVENLTGTGGDDVLVGDAGANILLGSGGDDVLQGLAGADTLDGGSGTNTASYANAAAAVIASLATGTYGGVNFTASGSGVLNGSTGSAGDASGDTLINIQNLIGSAYADTLIGDSNNNLISGGAGGDTIDGGAATDTVTYDSSSSAVTASLTAGSYNGITFAAASGGVLNGGNATTAGDAGGDTLINIENLTGSSYSDFLVGNSSGNTLAGGDGNDTLIGLGGGDTLIGGNGTNTVSYAGSGAVVASLTVGTFAGIGGNVTFTASNGGILNGGSTATANDAAGDLLIGIQNLTGSSNADTLVGDSGANVLLGGIGNDTLQGMGGADILDGGADNNTASYANAAAGVVASLQTGTYGGVSFTSSGGGILNGGNSTVAGDAAGDTLINIQNLTGSAYADTLIGDANANVLIGGAGGDTLNGAGGIDTVSYANATARVVSSLSAGSYGGLTFTTVSTGVYNPGTTSTAGEAGGDTLTGIENMIGSGYADILVGDANANVLDGGAGGDILNGLAGIDTVTYASASSGVIASLSTGTYSGVNFTSSSTNAGTGVLNGGTTGTAGQASGDTLVAIENLTGSASADTLVGDANANVLDGGAGNDILQGMGGADTLNGNGGNDTASYANATAGVVASLQTGTYGGVTFTSSGGGILNGDAGGTAGDAAGDTLISIENLTGSGLADVLVGDANANIIEGGGGGDVISGGSAGSDTASYANSSIGVVASLATGTYGGIGFSAVLNPAGTSGTGILNGGTAGTAGDAGGDTLVAIANLTGSALADILVGNSGANTLSGGIGNDILQGLGGADVLDGGAGIDTATYENAGAGVVASLSTGTYGGVSFTGTSTSVVNGGSSGTAGDAGGDTLSNMENLTGSNYADTLVGDANANVLVGGGGDDVLQGLAGGDTLDGGSGIDTASYANAGSGVIASLLAGTYGGVTFTNSGGGVLNTGSSALAGDAGGDLLTGMENLTGSAYADTLVAAAGSVIQGLAGNDTIYVSNTALPGTVDGGAGTDTVVISSLSSGLVSLSSLANLLSNVEVLNIRADGVNTTAQFTSADIQHIVNNGTSSALTVLASSGDVFSFSTSSGETYTTSNLGGGLTDYTIHNAASSTVAVVHWQVA